MGFSHFLYQEDLMDALALEKILISKLFTDDNYRDILLPFLKNEFFINPKAKKLIKSVLEYSKKYNAFPTQQEFISLYKGSESDQSQFLTECLLFKNPDAENGDWNGELLIDKTQEFFRHKMVADLNTEVASMVRDGCTDFGRIGGVLERAIEANNFTFDNSIGLDIAGNIDSVFNYFHSSTRFIPTMIKGMDDVTGGGLHEKTLNLIMAQPNLGKTLMKTAIGSNILTQGKKVLYITLEMSEYKIAERIMANLFNVKLNQLYTMDKQQFLYYFELTKKFIESNLIIKEFPTKGANANHFRSLLKELRQKRKFEPHIMMVDYLGLMIPNYTSKNSNSYGDVKQISEELRGLSVEHDIEAGILSSIQTNRKGVNQLDTDIDDMADSIGPAATADLIWAATQNDELKEQRLIQLQSIKNRFGEKNRKLLLKVDYEHMRVEHYDPEEELKANTAQVIQTGAAALLDSFGDTGKVKTATKPKSLNV